MSVTLVSKNLVRFLELLLLLTLLGSGEINPKAIFASILIALSLYIFNFVISERYLLFGFIFIFSISIFAIKKYFLTPLAVAPYALLAFQWLIWIMPSNVRNLGWRLSVTFLMLVLTSALTPDFFLAAVIFIYLLTSSVCLLTLYFESELTIRNRKIELKNFPRSLLGQAAGVTLLVLLLSLILFPILPRMNHFTQTNFGKTLPGYSEQVSTSGGPGFGQTVNREIVLKIRIPEEFQASPSEKIFPYGLLRARVLNLFDGKKWVGSSLKQDEATTQPTKSNQLPYLIFERSKLHTEILPVPYGTTFLEAKTEQRPTHLKKTHYDEWFHVDSFEQPIKYILQIDHNFKFQLHDKDTDLALKSYSKLPESLRLKIKKISNEIFKSKTDTYSANLILREFYKREGFSSTLEENVDPSIENFLLNSHKGHCEQFATASAFLLMSQGIPARIISGFKISHPPQSGLLIIRHEDAHAWAEYFNENSHQWVPIDLTPPSSTGWISTFFIRELRDKLEAFWFQNVVSYDDKNLTKLNSEELPSKSPRRTNDTFNGFDRLNILAIFGVFLSILLFGRFFFYNKLKSRRSLAIQLESKEGLWRLRRIKNIPTSLKAEYDLLRYGPSPSSSKEWKTKFHSFKKKLNSLTR